MRDAEDHPGGARAEVVAFFEPARRAFGQQSHRSLRGRAAHWTDAKAPLRAEFTTTATCSSRFCLPTRLRSSTCRAARGRVPRDDDPYPIARRRVRPRGIDFDLSFLTLMILMLSQILI